MNRTSRLGLLALGITLTALPSIGSAQRPTIGAPPQEQSLENAPPSAVLSERVRNNARTLHTQQQSGQQPNTVTLIVQDSTVAYVIRTLTKQAKLRLSYNSSHPALNQRIRVHVVDVPVMDALAIALKGTGLVAQKAPDGETVVVRPTHPTQDSVRKRQGSVRGKITDSASGRPIDGVTITIQGSSLSTLSQTNGEYRILNVPAGDQAILIKAFGYRAFVRHVTVVDAEPIVVNAMLASVPTSLSEVVTTATGTQRKIEIGNSIASINVDSVMQTAPIATLTDLLENRVPGLVVQRSSGQPGDPSRIRLRGASSVYNSNDPIIVVDGIRLDVGQTDFQGGSSNKVSVRTTVGDVGGGQYLASSPLDQIDPNSIETIDVFKGPSAAAMYGSDAANGVIVITTKRGRSGPASITGTATYGIAQMPGRFPEREVPFGRIYGVMEMMGCTPMVNIGCEVDSVISYSTLNDPYYSIVGTGHENGQTASVSAGSGAFNYSLTGSRSGQVGYVKMPIYLKDWYHLKQSARMPGWMNRPDHYGTWSGNARVSARVNSSLNVEIGHQMNSSTQRKLGLGQNSIPVWGQAYLPDTSQYGPYIARMFESMERKQSGQRSSLSVSWTRISWLPIQVTAGIDTRQIDDESTVPRGLVSGGIREADSLGRYGFGRTFTRDLSLVGQSRVLSWNDRIATAIGINVYKNQKNSMSGEVYGIPMGVAKPAMGIDSVRLSDFQSTLFGWYVEPKLNLKSKFFFVPGIRIDNNGSATKQNILQLPKMNMSWIASESDRFPFKHAVDLLRLRGAFGMAGVRNNIGDRLRTLRYVEAGYTDDRYSKNTVLGTLGNTQLRPERSYEFEAGFDLDWKGGRFSIDATQYTKVRKDAILNVPLPPSVMVQSGGTLKANVGVIRNSGREISATARVIESPLFGWTSMVQFSQNKNVVSRLDRSQVSWSIAEAMLDNTASRRVVAGYPLWGVWAVPLLGYEDSDHNGFITESEIVVGDSMRYLGQQEPKGMLVSNNTITLVNGRVSFNASMSYQYGMSQIAALMRTELQSKPDASLAEWALGKTAAISAYPIVQEVNTFRIESMSIQTQLGQQLTQRLGVRTASVALQASNVWKRSNYMGQDPNVNSVMMANTTVDIGTLVQPRRWTLRLSLGL